MAQNISVPDIGDFKDVEVIEVLVKPGDQINKNDPIVTIESDKSSVEIPSHAAGEIKDLKVENSGNDCLDFSFGQYKIENIDLKKCGDKGISVGEKSNAYFNNVKIQETNIGIASKDSSFVEVNNVNIIDTKTCVSAYKKKQEFNFADIKIENMDCFNFENKILTDKGSTVNIENL